MSHQIDTSAGRAAVFVTASSGGPAWHRLGALIDKARTSAQAIALAGLDWTVEQWPLLATDPRRQRMASVPRQVANVRTDTQAVLGVVGQDYHLFQNRECFDFMDALVGDRLAMFETAGALRGGRKLWMLARIPREYRAGPDDLIKPYVLLVNSHDGSTALRMLPTTIRVVCQNTLNLALRQAGGDGIAIRHRPSLEARVREARVKLGIIAARFDRFDAELHAMLEADLTSADAEAYFQALLPPPAPGPAPGISQTNAADTDTDASEAEPRQSRHRREMLDAFRGNFENELNRLPRVRGTAWAAYNAVSQWADHQRQVRGRTARDRDESRLDSIWFGSSHRLKQRAYQAALELAAAR